MGTTGTRDNWLHQHNFKIEIDSIIYAQFQEVTGLEYSFDVVEYREGGDIAATRKFVGQGRASNITLKRGITTDTGGFREWLSRVESGGGMPERKTGSIILCNDAGEEVKRWNFTGAWPVRWRGPELNSMGMQDAAYEEVVIAVETLSAAEEAGGGGGGAGEGGGGAAGGGGAGTETQTEESKAGGETGTGEGEAEVKEGPQDSTVEPASKEPSEEAATKEAKQEEPEQKIAEGPQDSTVEPASKESTQQTGTQSDTKGSSSGGSARSFGGEEEEDELQM